MPQEQISATIIKEDAAKETSLQLRHSNTNT